MSCYFVLHVLLTGTQHHWSAQDFTCTGRSLWQAWRHCVPLQLRLLWRQQAWVCESGGDEGSGDKAAGIAEWQRALTGHRHCDWHGESGRWHCGLRSTDRKGNVIGLNSPTCMYIKTLHKWSHTGFNSMQWLVQTSSKQSTWSYKVQS